METRSYRVAAIIILMSLLSGGIQAQQADSLQRANKMAVWLGLEVPSAAIHAYNGGYAFQPIMMVELGQHVVPWVAGGIMQYNRSSIYRNVQDYESEGSYFKAGVDLRINIGKQLAQNRSTSLRLGNGISFSRFRESGNVIFAYPEDRFPDSQAGNFFHQPLRHYTSAIFYELRQSLFFDGGRWAMQIQFQQGFMIKRPETPNHPVYFIPGTGILTDSWDFGVRGSRPGERGMIPSGQFYVFYRLY